MRTATFRLIRRGGYDPQQVDPFLEIIAQTLEGGPHADERIDGNYVHGVRFTTVRRGGYLPSQVDAFLDRVIDTFDGRKTDTPQPITDLGPPPVAAEPVPEPEPQPVTQPAPSTQAVALAEALTPVPAVQSVTVVEERAILNNHHEADFERLQVLHASGVLSDKEFAVLGARVRRRIATQQTQAGVGA